MNSDKYLNLIHRFALRLLQISSLEEILWLVAGQVIAELDFEDCVIYLCDPTSGHLIQSAAYGPKSPKSRAIVDPISIPIGEGIVGSVAATKRAEIITDTRLDDRYIKDDAFRLSELAVPILLNGECIGVIDSENSRLGFFKEEHENFLTTIASMAATKISEAIRQGELNTTIKKLNETQQTLAKQALDLIRIRKRTAEVEEINQSSLQIISRISHDIRTDLNALTGMSELLRETTLSNTQKKYVKIIAESSESLGKLVVEMLEHSMPPYQGDGERVQD